VTEDALDRYVDPVAEAAEYQQLLLRLLGDRDPGLVQAELVDQVAEVMEDAASLASTRPEPKEWSVLECLGHILDAEIVVSGRYRWILSEDEPPLMGYDQDLWVDRLHHPDDDPKEMLSLLRALRRANLDLWQRTPVGERSRVGMHSERGPESFDLTFRLMAGHGLFHLAQMSRTLAGVRDEV
jgi:hypothetical protein